MMGRSSRGGGESGERVKFGSRQWGCGKGGLN